MEFFLQDFYGAMVFVASDDSIPGKHRSLVKFKILDKHWLGLAFFDFIGTEITHAQGLVFFT